MADTPRTEVPLPAGISTNFQAGGMTFLQMLRRLRKECGVTGSDPATVLNLPGEMGRLADYLKQAWLDIQTLHKNWEFLKQPIRFVTAPNQQKYTGSEMQITSFGDIKRDSFTIYTLGDPSNEMDLPFMEYSDFRRRYMFGPARLQTNRPECFTLNGQRDFLLGPTPNAQYQIEGEGWAMPTELAGDNDRPACPGQFHMGVVYRAMMMYGLYESAPEQLTLGTSEFNKIIARLAADQLPTPTFGGPLA